VQELAGGSPVATVLTGLGIDEFFTRTDGSGTVSYLTEAPGSIVALADGSAPFRRSTPTSPSPGRNLSPPRITMRWPWTWRSKAQPIGPVRGGHRKGVPLSGS
jgi:hypothetical protein